ncbi:hypothetical protein XENORESO_017788 [Xenotaenia resolanae]|uniref:Uncharacterized protein n=1 Tax=Xenotaenia resolanae TaxID=208358 RepID=A0ABV0X941_9TELE
MVPLRPIYVDFLLIRAEVSILIFIFCPNLNRNLQNPTSFCSEENKKLMKSLVLIQYSCKHKLDPTFWKTVELLCNVLLFSLILSNKNYGPRTRPVINRSMTPWPASGPNRQLFKPKDQGSAFFPLHSRSPGSSNVPLLCQLL